MGALFASLDVGEIVYLARATPDPISRRGGPVTSLHPSNSVCPEPSRRFTVVPAGPGVRVALSGPSAGRSVTNNIMKRQHLLFFSLIRPQSSSRSACSSGRRSARSSNRAHCTNANQRIGPTKFSASTLTHQQEVCPRTCAYRGGWAAGPSCRATTREGV